VALLDTGLGASGVCSHTGLKISLESQSYLLEETRQFLYACFDTNGAVGL
jgi:hypothetical protein